MIINQLTNCHKTVFKHLYIFTNHLKTILNPQLRWFLTAFLLPFSISFQSTAQVYVEKQSRHRFAQLNLGFDFTSSVGGSTKFLNSEGQISRFSLQNTYSPRFLIGGTHFWGHADFYIAIPFLSQTMEANGQEVEYLRGVETVFKYYPWRIEDKKLRWYMGMSLAPFYFRQKNTMLEYGSGEALNYTEFPLLTGITYLHQNHLIELGLAWNYKNQQDYFISTTNQVPIKTPPVYLSLSYRYMLETTLGAEKEWESGQTEKITQQLMEKKQLNGFFVGVGLSSAFWLGESSYNTTNRPYITNYDTSILPDFSLGYYWHNTDLNLAANYRGYKTVNSAYGAEQLLRRKSIGLEATKYLFDFHGFVPFIGPVFSYEQLHFNETFENLPNIDQYENKFAYGITFGWDIRPNRLQEMILRTNLRYFPNLKLKTEDGTSINFNNLEFNFIQLIIYPQRL